MPAADVQFAIGRVVQLDPFTVSRIGKWQNLVDDYDARLDPHDHFVCTRCTMLVDVECGPRPTPARRGRLRGHRVEGRTLTYYGICRSCEAQAMRVGR